MKFAKYQQNNLVPEWRKKYLDYKKGKKLLKEITRARIRQRLTSSSTSRLQDGHDADSEDNSHSLPRSRSYGTIQPQRSSSLRQRSPISARSAPGPVATDSSPLPPMADTQQPVSPTTHSSDDSSTPIVPAAKPRSRKSIPAKPSPSSHISIRQVFDTFRRSRKRTLESLDEPVLSIHELDLDETEINFLNWLDEETKKIDDFYKQKEEDATERYKLLSAQLEALHRLRETYRGESENPSSEVSTPGQNGEERHRSSSLWKQVDRLRASMDAMSSPMPGADHQRRAAQPELMAHPISTSTGYVEYRVARRRLKQAVLEFYRAMELLKNYRLLNRTGLTKILKKFDKTAGRRMSEEYMEKVRHMHFDQSESLEKIMTATEDLFARYFEHNNRKNAVERLRSRDKPNQHIPAVFNVGFFLGLAIPLLLEGLVTAGKTSPNDIPQAALLLQVWGGFGLVILFLLLFGINCWAWTVAKINYTFIFEFDTKHHLDYRQYLELPTLLGFLGCLFFWLTFKNFWPGQLYATWYPLIYLCICVGILLFPLRTLHRSSRAWFAIANFRILFSGFYPIEYRDFFLGDQYNSLIYSFANAPLTFCLYANDWSPYGMTTCNSSHSRLLGFFSTLPPIWRFLQCIRRYVDTKNAFPHLVNAGKYSATILMYTMLSLWRIDGTDTYKALFIVFACANTLYCSFWDIFMDWSLGQPHAPKTFLRTDLGYKHPWVIVPFNFTNRRSSWLFYVVFPGQKQHSAATSFFIALGEVFRRFIWNFFRMENEHMTNVDHFIAARDVPLPFSLPSPGDTGAEVLEQQPTQAERNLAGKRMGSVRRGMVRMTSSLRIKHAEDFGRKPVNDKTAKGKLPDESDDYSSDGNGDEAEVQREGMETRNVEMRNIEEE